MNTCVAELMWGKDDPRTLRVRKFVTSRASFYPGLTTTRKQKVNEEWVTTSEVEEKNLDGDEFRDFCKAYLENADKWAEWVTASPALQDEARILWGQLLLVAQMNNYDFAVPSRMLRQWQKALAGRILQ